jgi:sulfate/thiosulfate transport system substrate-binding protein
MAQELWHWQRQTGRSGLQRHRWSAIVGFCVALALTGCQFGFSNNTVELTLASFSVTKAAYQQIIPKFEEKWWKEHQQRVSINQSYSGSGAQTRAIVDGLEADVAHLALGLDINKIVKAELIDDKWAEEFPNKSIVAQSVVAIVTRSGNPKNIQSWQDLARPDVQVITADPRSSGVARWIFMALWNSVTQGKTDDAATNAANDFTQTLYRRMPVLARDAQEATSTFFRQGEGDVLLNYENEVLLARDRGAPLDYQIPGVNISIDTPVAIIDRNVDQHGNREVVTAFVNFLFSDEAQIEFAKVGFRTQRPQATAPSFPKVAELATVKDFGGWSKIQKEFFAEGARFDQIYRR